VTRVDSLQHDHLCCKMCAEVCLCIQNFVNWIHCCNWLSCYWIYFNFIFINFGSSWDL